MFTSFDVRVSLPFRSLTYQKHASQHVAVMSEVSSYGLH